MLNKPKLQSSLCSDPKESDYKTLLCTTLYFFLSLESEVEHLNIPPKSIPWSLAGNSEGPLRKGLDKFNEIPSVLWDFIPTQTLYFKKIHLFLVSSFTLGFSIDHRNETIIFS